MATNAAAERITLHCFKCRTRTEYARLLASAPVYRCLGGCGNTREIHELGGIVVGQMPMPIPESAPVVRGPSIGIKRITRIKKKETKPIMKTETPIVALIKKTIAENPAAGVDADAVREIVREELALLGLPISGADGRQRRPTATASHGDRPKCPRGVHKGRHGQKCRDAGYVA